MNLIQQAAARDVSPPRKKQKTITDAKNKQLLEAATSGDVGKLQVLLDGGADIKTTDECNMTSLHRASQKGHLKAVRYLLDRGADKEALDKTKYTPLHLASGRDHFDVVSLLLKRGANIEAKSKSKYTPLHLACRVVSIEATDDCGFYTHFYHGSSKVHLKVVRLLLERGANRKARDFKNRTPLDVARANPFHRQETIDLLKNFEKATNSKNEFAIWPDAIFDDDKEDKDLKLHYAVKYCGEADLRSATSSLVTSPKSTGRIPWDARP